MKINFYLRFHTNFGQKLSVRTTILQPEQDDVIATHPMQYLNDQFWQAPVTLNNPEQSTIRYQYILTLEDGSQIIDGEHDRIIEAQKIKGHELQVIDTWNAEGWFENVFYTIPFQQTLLADRVTKTKEKPVKQFTHQFKVKAPLLKKDEAIFIIGNSIELGNWQKGQEVLLTREGNWWSTKLTLANESFPLAYKYGVYDTAEKEFVKLEDHEDRHLPGNASEGLLTVVHDGFVRCSFPEWKGAGTAIPVFSLKSKNSFGVGEFTDIKLLVDWAKEAGMKLVQLLPVNDTTATRTNADSYPYAAISAFALHPIYINLDKVAGKAQAAIMKGLKKKGKQLNDLPQLDYEQVIRFKFDALRELYEAQKEDYLDNPDFYAFYQTNKHWLVPYAAFSHLRDKNGTSDFSQWKTHSVYNKEAIEKYTSPKAKHYDEIMLYYYIQYHLHLQLKEAATYAHKKGVIVKGDIPIGVYRYGCDAWVEPQLYNMGMQAGAPPDDFAVKGQNWGFPTYNWEKMQQDGFLWWRQRFEQMSNYFDAFRIDHILGFFRIWSIPIDAVEGIMGYFVPAIPVHINEFGERGIRFDLPRFTKPFITDAILEKVFGNKADQVKEQFLQASQRGTYELKEGFATQRQVEQHFSQAAPGETDAAVREGLYDLISNVILFEEKGSAGSRFHFRINADKTPSFQHLEGQTQHQLRDLYHDYFYRRQDGFWKEEAMKKLPALKAATNMLVCGEDLGMVPHSVPAVMHQLGILSLEIQRMPKDPHARFTKLSRVPYLSVVTPSTHDMSTIRGWWEEDKQTTGQFFAQELGQLTEAPAACTEWISKAIVLQHLHSPAMWSIFQLQDLFGMDESLRVEDPAVERINIPADSKHYWGYRMHVTLEHLIKEKALSRELKAHIDASNR
ncbi:MAG: 4-alpha-glucanotransferase [Williamsia sp.]|nr:4-alpha-glucanotransferase [Williamsia sp.]